MRCRSTGWNSMIKEWKEFLQMAGAELDDSGVANFGNLRRELSVAITGNVFADLSHYGLIAVHGDDAETFLQGQLTNDVSKLDGTQTQLNGLCNPKGRLLASFRLFRYRDSFYLCLPADMVEGVINRLRMFVLRSQVTLEEAGDTFVHLGISGKDAAESLSEFAGSLPEAVDTQSAQDDLIILKVPGIHPSYEVFTTVAQATELWAKLNVRSAPVGAEAWRLLNIQAGVPVIYPETREAFVPQMANLQLVNGVSFKKGCYTGQEIVARMQYLGKLKRRMYAVRFTADEMPATGGEIFDEKTTDQSCGRLVSVARHPDGDYAALAVLQIGSAEDGRPLHLGSAGGPLLKLDKLPYPFPDED